MLFQGQVNAPADQVRYRYPLDPLYPGQLDHLGLVQFHVRRVLADSVRFFVHRRPLEEGVVLCRFVYLMEYKQDVPRCQGTFVTFLYEIFL